ncbi:MAG: hypothetical protein HQK99_13015 [Nitrospirae bacterium]|nr:hypothetical protein [Nitrospirota bacterium]
MSSTYPTPQETYTQHDHLYDYDLNGCTEYFPKEQSAADILMPSLFSNGKVVITKAKDKPGYETCQITDTDKDAAVLDEIEARIFDRLVFPSDWAEEGIEPPNIASKEKAFEICKHIFEKYDIVPGAIAPTKEEGVFIAFDSLTATLNIEVYNNLEAWYLVNDNVQKKIIVSGDITDFALLDDAIKYFNG